jgi:hypothetical protein
MLMNAPRGDSMRSAAKARRKGWIAPASLKSKAGTPDGGGESFAVHSLEAALRLPRLERKFQLLNACRAVDFAFGKRFRAGSYTMSDHANSPGNGEQAAADIDAATRRLMAALEALESAVERRRDADRDEAELAARIQALGADRSRLADELDGSLVKSGKLERANREIAQRLDAAIDTIRSVLDPGEAP